MNARENPLIAALLIALACVLVFALEDDGRLEATNLGVSGMALGDGEWARALTFMFAHCSAQHLLVNLVGLAAVAVLAWELRLSSSAFLGVFVVVSMLTVVPVALLLEEPYVFLGASAGVSGLFGAVAVEFRRYGFPAARVLLLFALALVVGPLLEGLQVATGTAAMQALMHLTALVVGAELALSRAYWSPDGRTR